MYDHILVNIAGWKILTVDVFVGYLHTEFDGGFSSHKCVSLPDGRWWFQNVSEIVVIILTPKLGVINLGGGFKYFLFSPLFGEMIQFD